MTMLVWFDQEQPNLAHHRIYRALYSSFPRTTRKFNNQMFKAHKSTD